MSALNKKFLLILSIFIFSPLLGQSTKSGFTSPEWDDYNLLDWYSDARPLIELNYGFGIPKQKNFTSSFNDIGIAEIRLGYSTLDTYHNESLLELEDKFIATSYLASKIGLEGEAVDKLNSELWRFGFATRKGYGYKIGEVGIIPYHQTGLSWSNLKMKDFPEEALKDDNDILNRYEGSFRFGTTAEGGLKFEIASLVAINVSYQASVIYPRHLFWKQVGSYALEGMGLFALESFIEEIIDSSPMAGPIVNFILKNGYTYAFYALKRGDMNWPFSTETPLTYETVNFGITFVF